MSTASKLRRPDAFVLSICGVAAALMVALMLGASRPSPQVSSTVIVVFVALGLAPYALTVALSCLAEPHRLVVGTTRTVAIVYGVFDNFIRYQALYHPASSTDAVVVVVLPFWWIPCLVFTGLFVGVALVASNWRARRRPAQ